MKRGNSLPAVISIQRFLRAEIAPRSPTEGAIWLATGTRPKLQKRGHDYRTRACRAIRPRIFPNLPVEEESREEKMDRRFAKGVHKTVKRCDTCTPRCRPRRIGRPSGYNRDIQPILRDAQILCHDALRRDGVHRLHLPYPEKTRRGAKESRIKPGRMYRRESRNAVAGDPVLARCRGIGKFPVCERWPYEELTVNLTAMVGWLRIDSGTKISA